MIIECKKLNNRKDRAQLEKYLGLCDAQMGIWYDGDNTVILKKKTSESGYEYEKMNRIPDSKTDIENMKNQIYKKDLVECDDLKKVMDSINEEITSSPITTDISNKASEILNLILCKIFDERNKRDNELVDFYVAVDEDPQKVSLRVGDLFDEVKQEWESIFNPKEEFTMPPELIKICVEKLQPYKILDSNRDAVGEAFQTFIGEILRSQHGQYFTPRNMTSAMVEILDPEPRFKIYDPTSGSGGMLITALQYLENKIDRIGEEKGWADQEIGKQKAKVASQMIYGRDKDVFLTKVCKAYMAIMGDGSANIYQGDSLNKETEFLKEKEFECVISNPPYGKPISIKEEKILRQYELGKKENGNLRPSVQPQILFIERIIGQLKEGHRAAVVLPESMFSNPQDRHVMQYIRENTKIEAIISIPPEAFKTSETDKKTVILVIKKIKADNYNIFMAKCDKVGIDKRAKHIEEDDLPEVVQNYKKFLNNGEKIKSQDVNLLGFCVNIKDIEKDVFTPHTYWYKIKNRGLAESIGETVSIGTLIEKNVISLQNGGGKVKEADYTAHGEIPYIRTTDIQNLELSYKPSRYITKEKFDIYNADGKYDIHKNDVLLALRGRINTDVSEGRIGAVALVTEGREKIAYQGAITRIRIENLNNEYGLTPQMLAFLLSERHIKEQIKELAGVEKALTGVNRDSLMDLKIRLVQPRERKTLQQKAKDFFDAKAKAYFTYQEFLDG